MTLPLDIAISCGSACVNLKKHRPPATNEWVAVSDEHVLICVAWPYANGPLHLGHVAGCYLPPDIQYRFERALGNRVLMVSGSDEHGTPITVTAETQGVMPQQVVDEYHEMNLKALVDLGCSWAQPIDARGSEYGGALFNRTTDPEHKRMVQDNFRLLESAGFFERKTTEQYYEVHDDGGGRFLPDRYVEGTCPACGSDGARGDQCDACGATYEAVELKNPVSKMNPSASIEIRETDHLFYRLDLFQEALEQHADAQQGAWKSNVRAMTKQWLDMGLRPRAVTRDLEWGIPVPMDGEAWKGKCVYVWFEAVQGYSTCARIWSARHESDLPDGADTWKRWWTVNQDGTVPRHLYFLGKDNIPFHTVIWPALILGLNQVAKGLTADDKIVLPGPGEFPLETNVPAMEYLMLAGGQFSKSRKHAIWLPSFLERYPADTLRYYLSAQMPEEKDSDFTWDEFVAKVNNVLNANYGNFVHRVLTLGARLPHEANHSPFALHDGHASCNEHKTAVEQAFDDITNALKSHRYKDALNIIMSVSQMGNQILQTAAPWKHLNEPQEGHEASLGQLAFCWRIARFLSITTQPFMPNSAQQLWFNLGNDSSVSECPWSSATDWNAPLTWREDVPKPLFDRLDLEEILAAEQGLVEDAPETPNVHGIKGGKKKHGGKKMKDEPEGIAYLDFETFMEVNLRVGRISSVDDHPNADKLYVVALDDGTERGRTICAGLKEHYAPEEMEGKLVVFVENLKPRPLRGITSEGMMLAADDGNGRVVLVTLDGDIAPGSQVR